MSKVGQAFGGKGAKKPSTAEIFFTLAAAQKEKERLAAVAAATAKLGATSGVPGTSGTSGINASLAKFDQGRRKKSSRLKRGPGGPIADDDDAIVRPGARKATLLGQ